MNRFILFDTWLALLSFGLVLVSVGCGRTEKSGQQPFEEKPKFQYQSKLNSLPCQNQFRLNPNNQTLDPERVLQVKETLELERAEVYVELQDQEGRSLRNSAARIAPNPISGQFGAIILCSSAQPTDASTKWGMANLPMTFRLQENLIPKEIGVILPTVGENMNWTHPAYVQGFTSSEPNAALWFQELSLKGQIEISQTANAYEIMFSQRFSPMAEGKSWFQFVLAQYRVVKP